MKRGAKRPALFDYATDPADVDLQSKRVIEAPSFADHRAESSHQQLREGPPLDVPRAKLALQHVRALNKQFVSWVQSQTQNHLDELWEDGLKDYLSHASNITEGFKDIVEWLRTNAEKSQSKLPTASPSGQTIPVSTLPTIHTSQNMVMPSSFLLPKSESKQDPVLHSNQGNSNFETKSAISYPSPETNFAFSIPQTSSLSCTSQSRLNSNTNNGFSKLPTSAILPMMQSSIIFSNSQSLNFFATSGTQAPTFPGIQNSTPQKVESSDDADEEGELEQPSSPSLKKTEEEGVVIVHEAKCKVYIKPEHPAENGWKDMGTGHLSIKCKGGIEKATKESKPTIIVRNDVGKILLNALIYTGIKMNIQKKSIVSIFHTTGGEQGSSSIVAQTYLLRLKSVEDATKLAQTIQEYAPST